MFPQLKNKFPEIHSELSWNSLQLNEIEKDHSVCVKMPAKVHNLPNINTLFKRIVHSLGVGPSTKKIDLCKRALKNCFFSSHKSHICVHIYISFPYFWISWNYLSAISQKLPGIQEISFKRETLRGSYTGAVDTQRNMVNICTIQLNWKQWFSRILTLLDPRF